MACQREYGASTIAELWGREGHAPFGTSQIAPDVIHAPERSVTLENFSSWYSAWLLRRPCWRSGHLTESLTVSRQVVKALNWRDHLD